MGSISSPLFIARVCTALFCRCILAAKLSKSAILEMILLKTDEVRRCERTRCQVLFVLCSLVSISNDSASERVIVMPQ
uniref:Secreted protein n=1 Tax=Anguilla anguilla TaxID=7936 RepID=A0A0E9WEH6_ANGAN